MKPSRLLIAALFVLTALVWGFTWPLYVVALRSFSPLLIVSVRNLIGAAVVLAMMTMRRTPLPRRWTEWRLLLALGVLWIAIPSSMVIWAIQHTSSGLASVLSGTGPFFVALFSMFLLRQERVTAAKVAGIVLAFAGVVLILSDAIGPSALGNPVAEITLVSSAVVGALAMVMAKRHGSEIPATALVAVVMGVGGAVLLAVSLAVERPVRYVVTIESAGTLLYLGFFSSAFGFAAFTWLLKHVDAVKLSMIAFIVPVIAIGAGILLLGEKLSAGDLIGALLVAAGLLVVNTLGSYAQQMRLRQKTGLEQTS